MCYPLYHITNVNSDLKKIKNKQLFQNFREKTEEKYFREIIIFVKILNNSYFSFINFLN